MLRQLKNHAAIKWREIGIHLGFLPGELDNIGARPNLSQGAPVSWFGAMLESWLQWAPGDCRGSTSFATLEDLKVALGEAGLGASAYDLTLQTAQIGESHKLIVFYEFTACNLIVKIIFFLFNLFVQHLQSNLNMK